MPVVPFDNRPKAPIQRKLSAEDEPWVLMAAAQMDRDGRLVDTPKEPGDEPTRQP